MRKLNINELKILEDSLKTEKIFYENIICETECTKNYEKYCRKQIKNVEKLLIKIRKEVSKYDKFRNYK